MLGDLLGAHVSTAGGVDLAPARARAIGATASGGNPPSVRLSPVGFARRFVRAAYALWWRTIRT